MSAHDLPALPEDIQSLLDQEKPLVPLPHEARTRLSSRLRDATVSRPRPSRAASLMRRAGSAAIFFAAGTAFGIAVERRLARPAPAAAPLPEAIVPFAGAPAGDAPPAAVSTEVSPARAPAGDPIPAPHPTVAERGETPARAAPPAAVRRAASHLADERAELETARAAMMRGRWDDARAALDRHASTYPNGQLAEERDSMRVVLLVHEGRVGEARAAGRRFERAYPTSLFLAVVHGSLDSMTDGADAGQVLGEP